MLKQIIKQEPVPGSVPQSERTAPASDKSPPPASRLRDASPSGDNFLGGDVQLKGSLRFSKSLRIDGRIEGEVTSDGHLTVGANAEIKGEIRTNSVDVFGKVEGNITTRDHCELKKDAEIVGDISAGTLSIEAGATFVGSSAVGKAAEKSSMTPRSGDSKMHGDS